MKFVFIGLIGIIAADIYIWYAYIRKKGLLLKILHWIPLIGLFFSIAIVMNDMAWWPTYILTALILGFFLPKFVFAILTALGNLSEKIFKHGQHIGLIAGLSAGLVLMSMNIYGLTFGWKRITVKNITTEFYDLPESFDGFRIIHLSDMHIGTYSKSPQTVKKIVDTVNGLKPDLILFTGDMINMSPDEFFPFISEISKLKAKAGVYSVLGNHDYCGYARYSTQNGQKDAVTRLIGMEREAGMNLLMNENRIIHNGCDSIALIGVENDGLPPFPERGDLMKAQKGLPDGIFKILMSHDPTHWHRKVLPDTDIDLTLSGHTHAMQLKIGNFSPSMFVYPEWGGLYTDGARLLYVSTGTGGNIAFRWGAWPEIDVITLKKRK